MPFHIIIGAPTKTPDGETVISWPLPGPQSDGSSPQHNPRPGYPYRAISMVYFSQWLKDDPAIKEFYRCIKANDPRTTPSARPITKDLLQIANRLVGCTPGEVDRARWLQYWLVRARQEFGPQAMIEISCP